MGLRCSGESYAFSQMAIDGTHGTYVFHWSLNLQFLTANEAEFQKRKTNKGLFTVNKRKKAFYNVKKTTELETSGKQEIFHSPLFVVTADLKLLHTLIGR